jgi:hypothetical protein
LLFTKEEFNIINQWKQISIRSEYLKEVNNNLYQIISNGQIVISPFISQLGNKCFYSCLSLTSINLPSSLQSLGDSCF